MRTHVVVPGDYTLLLLEVGAEILRGVHPTLAERARQSLWHEGIEIRTSTPVTHVRQGDARSSCERDVA